MTPPNPSPPNPGTVRKHGILTPAFARDMGGGGVFHYWCIEAHGLKGDLLGLLTFSNYLK